MVDDWAPGTIKIPLPRLIIALYGSNFATIFAHFISQLKNWALSRGYFGSRGHPLLAVAVVKRFKQESMYGLSGGPKKVAVVERWPLVEVRLHCYLSNRKRFPCLQSLI